MKNDALRHRRRVLGFLIQSAHDLQVSPIVKYSALSIFADRFYPYISRKGMDKENWLLDPMRESNLQLFALASIWISCKIHISSPISVKCLKSLGDKSITEQHFTTRDFLEAVLKFEIGVSNIAYKFLEDLIMQLKHVARVGEHVNFEACMDIMDLLYEKEESSDLFNTSNCLAASILARFLELPLMLSQFLYKGGSSLFSLGDENGITFLGIDLFHRLIKSFTLGNTIPIDSCVRYLMQGGGHCGYGEIHFEACA